MGNVTWTEESFRAALAKKSEVVQVASDNLRRTVRRFLDDFAPNGSKTGRADYVRLIPLDRIETLRRVADERDRVAAMPLDRFATTEPNGETP